MDTRVKPAYDAEYVAAPCSNWIFTFQTAKLPRSRGALRPRYASPSRDLREGVERREAPECLRCTL